MKRPVYILNYSVEVGSFELSINDIPVVVDGDIGNVFSRIALNPWVRKGENYVTLKIENTSDNKLKESKASMELGLVESHDRLEEGKQVVESKETDSSIASMTSTTIRIVFVSDIEHLNPIYETNGERLKPSPKLFKQLLEKYQEIHGIMKNKDLNSFLTLNRVKDMEWSSSVYLSYEDRVKEIRMMFDEIFKLDLLKIEQSMIELKVFNEGKLFAIQYPKGFDLICFANKDLTHFEYIPIVFYFDKTEKDFILVR